MEVIIDFTEDKQIISLAGEKTLINSLVELKGILNTLKVVYLITSPGSYSKIRLAGAISKALYLSNNVKIYSVDLLKDLFSQLKAAYLYNKVVLFKDENDNTFLISKEEFYELSEYKESFIINNNSIDYISTLVKKIEENYPFREGFFFPYYDKFTFLCS